MLCLGASAQGLQPVKLNAPDKTRGAATMKALSDRHSDRVYDEKDLSIKDLSDLLWAANGINRPDGKRTAPSAMDKREIDVYLICKDGAYLYDAQEHSLKPIAAGDHRGAVAGGQDFVKAAPVSIVTVIDLAKLGDPTLENTRLIGAVDAGIVTQNIDIFCAGVGLSTVPRATMDKDALRKILKLRDTQLPIMNNPVGYPKK
ncbi:MAG: SagB/ThcOx family dehydrogenase [Tannerella sp.]|jgi:SagB-type dehydrogenase family enzyme|nr:SagB/ThcOx family dehydrogenase [Tannerella sp.]